MTSDSNPYIKVFEPTVCVFENGLLIQYKKVGTRFFRTLVCNGQENVHTDNKQIDFVFTTYEKHIDNINDCLEYKFFRRYVSGPWYEKRIRAPENLDEKLKSYPRWNTDDDFLTEMGVKSYTELFFENKKDIVFLVRNPIDRFFSGVTQTIIAYFAELDNWPEEIEFVKSKLEISDEVFELVVKSFTEAQFDSVPVTENLSPSIIKKIFKFFIFNKWGMIIRDVHAEPYLVHFKEMIYNMKDISRVKIIDLAHLRTPAADDFFSKLRNTTDNLYAQTLKEQRKEDNSPIYKHAINLYRTEELFVKDVAHNDSAKSSVISEYLKQEITTYYELINSPHFINLGI